MGTFSSNILPSATGEDLGSPSQRWDVFGQAGDFSTTLNVTGNATLANLNNIRFADQFPGSDIGAKITAAIADLPTAGGIVDCRAVGGTISSTVLVGSNTKNVTLLLGCFTYSGSISSLFIVHCRSKLVLDAGTVIQQTSNSGHGIILSGGNSPTGALRGGIFGTGLVLGPGQGVSTGVGVVLGGTSDTGNVVGNAANYVLLEGFTVTGFGTGEKYGNNVYIISHKDTIFTGNALSVSYPSGLTNSGETICYRGCLFASGTSTFANFSITGPSADIIFSQSSFDQCAFVINAANFVHARFYGCHFENPNGASAQDFISISGFGHVVQLNDIHLIEDGVSARTRLIYVNSPAHLSIFGGTYLAAQVTAALAQSDNASAMIDISAVHHNNISAFLSGTWAGSVLSSSFTPGVGAGGTVTLNGTFTAPIVAGATVNSTTVNATTVNATTLASAGLTLTGKATNYNNIPTVSNGVPAEYATVDLTAQGAAITTTTLYAVPASGAGQYRVQWNTKITTVDAVSSTLGALTIGYTDPDGVALTMTAPATILAGTIATSSTGNVTSTALMGLPLMLNCKASTNVTYAFAYVSNTPGQMKFNLHLKLEAL